MKKKEFIQELSNKTGLDNEKCILINSVVEDTFIIGRHNKEKMIEGFIEVLKIDRKEANNIYNQVSSIIANNLKEKIRHPFKSQD